jgi:hypothetical protein
MGKDMGKEGEWKDDNNILHALNALNKGRKEKNKFALLIYFLSFFLSAPSFH